MDQLIKHKDIRKYSQLYIPNDHKLYIRLLRLKDFSVSQ